MDALPAKTAVGIDRRSLLSSLGAAALANWLPRLASAQAQTKDRQITDFRLFVNRLAQVKNASRRSALDDMAPYEMLEWAIRNQTYPPLNILFNTPLDPAHIEKYFRLISYDQRGLTISSDTDTDWLNKVIEAQSLRIGFGNGLETEVFGRRLTITAGHVIEGRPISAAIYRIHHNNQIPFDLAAIEKLVAGQKDPIGTLAEPAYPYTFGQRSQSLYGSYVQGIPTDPDERASINGVKKLVGGIAFPAHSWECKSICVNACA